MRKQNEAAGNYRSRGRKGPCQKRTAWGESRRNQQEAIEAGVAREVLVERELRGGGKDRNGRGCSQRRGRSGKEAGGVRLSLEI